MLVMVEDYVDTVAQVLVYNGDDPIVLEFGSEFTVPSVKVTDNYDSNPIYTHELKDEAGNVISNIDTTIAGNYSLIYTATDARSEEHTSELQSRGHLVCRLLLEKKN